MAVSVVMPALELAQESGKLLGWLKKEGDAVAKGDMIAEIETDKAVFELESPGEGVLAGMKASAGDMVPVGQTIAWIVARGEQPPAEDVVDAAVKAMQEQARKSSTAAPAVSAPAAKTTQSSLAREGAGRPPRISPKARR